MGLISLSTISCSNNSNKEISRGIYFWKTNFSLSTSELNWLKKTEIQKLYVRFFDVDWNANISKAVPVGDVTIETKKINGVETVSYTHLRAHETVLDIVCRLLLEKKTHQCLKYEPFLEA